MTQRVDRVEYKNGNQKEDRQMQVEDFRVFPEDILTRVSIDTFDAGFLTGHQEGVRDALTHADLRVCGGCGKIVFKTNFLGYCEVCVAWMRDFAIRFGLSWLVIGLVVLLSR